MHSECLRPKTRKVFSRFKEAAASHGFILAGGTALALHMGHRVSEDLDFFTNHNFDEQVLSLELSKFKEFREEGKSWKTIWGWLSKTKFSIFYYKYPLIEKAIEFEGIRIANKEDIAAMKIHAIEERGTRRDFVDVYILAKEFSLEQMFLFYDKKYAVLEDHLYGIIRSLSYFEDAEKEHQMPKMIESVSWDEVKRFFEKEAVRLGRKYLH